MKINYPSRARADHPFTFILLKQPNNDKDTQTHTQIVTSHRTQRGQRSPQHGKTRGSNNNKSAVLASKC